MLWEVDGKSQKRLSDIARALKGADRLILATDPDREGEAISWHVLEVLKNRRRSPTSRSSASSSTPSPASHPRGHEAPARHRRRAGRCLSRPPRARLSRRLHALPGAVAQAPRRPLRRPRAVGGAEAGLRPRERDRDLRRQEYWSVAVTLETPRTAASSPASSAPTARSSAVSTFPTRRRSHQAASEVRRLSRRLGRGQAGEAQSAAALHHLDAAAGGLAQARLFASRTMQVAQRLYEASRAHHLYAHRRRAERAGSGRRPRDARHASATATCRRSRASTRPRRRTRRKPTRPSARPLRRTPSESQSRGRSGPALRADLEAHDRQPDAGGRAGAHHGRDRRRPAPAIGCAPPARWCASTAS